MQNYKLEKEVKNRADWEKSNKEAKVHTGLLCHQRGRIISIVSLFVTVMRGIHNYKAETNLVSWVYNVAAVLWLQWLR
jgi:hypothetical protein